MQKLTPELEAKAVDMLRERVPFTTIMSTLDIGKSLLSDIRFRHELGVGHKNPPPPIDDRVLDEVIERYKAGEGFCRLSRVCHTSQYRLKRILIARGIQLRQTVHSDEIKKSLIEAHRFSNKWSHEIYKEHGVSEASYSNWTRGIPRENAPKQDNPMQGTNLMEIWTRKHGKEIATQKQQALVDRARERSIGEKNHMYGRPSPQGAGSGWKGWYNGHYFRSLREATFMINMDERGIKWESGETISIPYEMEGRKRTYRPDFITDDQMIEIKPIRLHTSPSVVAKQKAGQAYAASHGMTYVLQDIEIDSTGIGKALTKGLIKFAGDYEERFLAYVAAT